MKRELIFAAAACALVACGLALAFMVLGSPGHQRSLAIDIRRINDLSGIVGDLNEHYPKPKPLPVTLPPSIAQNDPVSARPYAYRRLGARSYELCAIFAAASTEDRNTPHAADLPGVHGPGRQCFTVDANAADQQLLHPH